MRPTGPTSYLLDGRTGWRTAHAAGVAEGVTSGVRLAADLDGPLSLAANLEELGRLTLPRGMAFDAAGILYLLGQDAPWIKRFDPEARAFTKLPTLGDVEDEVRRFNRPSNIAFAARNLYVVDTGNRRVLVFDRESLALRHLWRHEDWKPVDVATHAGRACVLDGQKGRIYVHRLGTDKLRLLVELQTEENGGYKGQRAGLGEAPHWTRLVLDRQGYIYVLEETEMRLHIYDPSGKYVTAVDDAGDVRDQFDPPLLIRDQAGRFCLPARLVGSPLLRPDDIKDPIWLATKLRQGRTPLSKFLAEEFQPYARHLLDTYAIGKPPSAALNKALLKELNRLLAKSRLFEQERFLGIALSKETRLLIQQRPTGQQLIRLNRRLLVEAFPDEIAPGCSYWLYGPDAVVEPPTPGHPLAMCPPFSPDGLLFDRVGEPATAGDPSDQLPPVLYRTLGTWVSQALDSDQPYCQWHRIEVDLAALPTGSKVAVSTFTNEEALSERRIQTLSEEQWETRYAIIGEFQPPPDQMQRQQAQKRHEFLVQSRKGQYLWLRLELFGDGYATPAVKSIRVHYPRTSYLRYLPAVFAADDERGWFLERYLSIIQTEWDKLEEHTTSISRYFDPKTVPAGEALRFLAGWLALPLEGEWSEEQKRRLLKAAPEIDAQRGTVASLRRYLQVYLHNITGVPSEKQGLYPQIIEGYRERQHLLLAAKDTAWLGQGAPLWGPAQVGRLQLDVFSREGDIRLVSTSDPERDVFFEYANRFRVFIPAAWVRTAEDETMVRRALDAEKPAHTQYDLCLVEPRLRVGLQSTVGLDTIIGAYPLARLACCHSTEEPPSRLPQHRLGYDTVLAGTSDDGDIVQVGHRTRVGIGTVII